MNEALPANLIILLLVLIGIVLLQIFLAKRESRWLGLILPAINVFISLITVFGLTFYANESSGQMVMAILPILLLYNIPTLILLAIYFACREKLRNIKEIEKMSIQDL